MLDDALRLQGRSTAGKWKTAIIGILLAALALTAALLTANSAQVQRYATGLLLKMRTPDAGLWHELPLAQSAAGTLESGVLLAGEGCVCMVSPAGKLLWRQDLPWEYPVIETAGDQAVIYAPGEAGLMLADANGVLLVEVAGGVDFSAANPTGGAAVVTAGSGYLTRTLLLDGGGNIEGTVPLTDAAMAMAAWLPEGILASCCVSPGGAWKLRLDGSGTLEIPLTADVVYDLKPCGDRLALWTSEGISMYGTDGSLLWRTGLDPETVIDWDCSEYPALLLRRVGRWELMTLEPETGAESFCPLPGKPTQLLVAEEMVCVLDKESLRVYDRSCSIRNTCSAGGADRILPVEGAVLLLGDQRLRCVFLSEYIA